MTCVLVNVCLVRLYRKIIHELSPVHTHKPYTNLSIAPACIRDISFIKHWNINEMCNKASEKAGCCQY